MVQKIASRYGFHLPLLGTTTNIDRILHFDYRKRFCVVPAAARSPVKWDNPKNEKGRLMLLHSIVALGTREVIAKQWPFKQRSARRVCAISIIFYPDCGAE